MFHWKTGISRRGVRGTVSGALGLIGFFHIVTSAAPDEPISPATILIDMAETYRTFDSYQDKGVVELVDPQSGKRKIIFETSFVRPDRFRFDWLDLPFKALKDLKQHHVLWWTGDVASTYWEGMPEVTRSASMGEAVSAATGISLGSAHWVPRLLMPEVVTGMSIADLKDPLLVGEERFGGSMCYRVRGAGGDDVIYDVWIEKEDRLLRKIESHVDGVMMTEIRQKITFNKPIPASRFDFEPPRPKT